MEATLSLPHADWHAPTDAVTQAQAVEALESGRVLILSQLPFTLSPQEQAFLRTDCVRTDTKSVKFSQEKQAVWGMASANDVPQLKPMLQRYAECARNLVAALLPGYVPSLIMGNTSFRPVEAEGRVQSKRHDDRRLHVDAFPSRPNGGQRILRVFTNVHPGDRPRMWRVGEPFADVCAHFLPSIRPPLPGSSAVLRALRITKGTRTAYDHYMLQLHDHMKLDDDYQREAPQAAIAFPPGTSWVVFSDQVSHAAMSGQHLMEQTFMLPVAGMHDPALSPLKVLERQTGKPLS